MESMRIDRGECNGIGNDTSDETEHSSSLDCDDLREAARAGRIYVKRRMQLEIGGSGTRVVNIVSLQAILLILLFVP